MSRTSPRTSWATDLGDPGAVVDTRGSSLVSIAGGFCFCAVSSGLRQLNRSIQDLPLALKHGADGHSTPRRGVIDSETTALQGGQGRVSERTGICAGPTVRCTWGPQSPMLRSTTTLRRGANLDERTTPSGLLHRWIAGSRRFSRSHLVPPSRGTRRIRDHRRNRSSVLPCAIFSLDASDRFACSRNDTAPSLPIKG